MISGVIAGLCLAQAVEPSPTTWKELVTRHVQALAALPYLLEYEGVILEGESAYPMSVRCLRSGSTAWGSVEFAGSPTAETWQDENRQVAAYHTTREYAILKPSSFSPIREWEIWSEGPFPKGEVQMQVLVTGIVVFAVGEEMSHVSEVAETLTTRETVRHTFRSESGGSIRVMTIWVEKSSGIIARLQFRARDSFGDGIDSYLALRKQVPNPPPVIMTDEFLRRKLAGYLELKESDGSLNFDPYNRGFLSR